uniref:Period circadian protein homolog 2 n=1 Tax=Esox lucius TaxID=8010 RepID=A0A6Q2WU54_ESOLU
MSEASAKQYFTVEGSEMDRERNLFQIEENGGSPCEPVSQLHCMSGFGEDGGAEVEPELGLASEGSDSSQDQPASPSLPHDDRKRPHPALHEDVEMTGCGSGSGTESHGNESHGNESHGNVSLGSFNGNSCSAKDSALLESSGSNKSSNTHSPSPPSSSIAFSLVSSEQDNPSTSGCSSEQSAKAKTQKELCKTLKELKMHPPSDKRCKGKASTLHTLTYALRCVKQVQASEEYYRMLMIKDRQPPGLEMSSYTVEEISSITSEYTNKNTDMFAVTVSLITGRIVYISDQATTILHCHRDRFSNAKFVEFLTPQDVSVFYSFTAPYRLPSWSMCTGSESSPSECMQEKSFFCRISGGKEREGSLQYYPFRMTPYLMKVQGAELSEEQFCCLLLAERVHSGYDAPRIPSDKRIFTTTHTPSCLFQEVDERAVPLLGYLPQDLKGTPVLLHLHPSDRPLMLAVHRKILQSVGQPFDHSIRFCARNGEYITIDTSWSSFVNPWSRKVSFVIGRHKVRMGPVNEDVFAVPAFTNEKLVDPDTREITEQIHRTLLQPVHNMGSSGYGSHGSNASHEPLRSVASPSESNSNGNVRTFQEICKGVHMLKNQEQQVYQLPSSKLESTRTTESESQESLAVRVKESAVPPLSVKDSAAPGDVIEELICKDQTVYSYQQISCLDGVVRYLESCNVPITVKRRYQLSSNTTSSNSDEDKKGSERNPGLPTKALKKRPSGAAPVVGGHMSPLAPPNKADSVVSITSQCSYSSTIVHVGDKKPQPDSEITEDVAESPAPPMLPVCVVSPPSQEKEAYKRLGLTKHVLAAHTQKEEQAFLTRCKDLKNARTFQKHCSNYLHRQRVSSNTLGQSQSMWQIPWKGSRNKKSKKPRMKRPDSSDSAVSHRMPLPPLQGLNQTSWSPSEASQSQAFPIPYPAIVPGYPLPVYPAGPATPDQPTCPDPSLSAGFGEGQSSLAPPTAAPYPASLMTPVVALVVPNYLFPQIGPIGQIPSQTTYTTQQPFPAQMAYTAQPVFPSQPSFPVQAQFVPQVSYPTQAFPFGLPSESPKSPAPSPASHCSTPASTAREPASSPPLFESRCSSPLQLNLLQLDDSRSAVGQDSVAPPSGAPGSSDAHSDGHSSSSDLLDMVLHDETDSTFGSGSGSGCKSGSGSNDTGTSSGASGSRNGGYNTSRYFGSVDSLEKVPKATVVGKTRVRDETKPGQNQGDGEHLGYVPQEPFWMPVANASDDNIMMNYEVPSRDIQNVLRQDKERLRQMQKCQPHFSSVQRRELVEVHPWMKRGILPKTINVKVLQTSCFIHTHLPLTQTCIHLALKRSFASHGNAHSPLTVTPIRLSR